MKTLRGIFARGLRNRADHAQFTIAMLLARLLTA
jgi:hypothetical protein